MAAVYEYNCSLMQGFNFKPDIQDMCGYVTLLSIGGTTITADLGNIKTPTDSATMQTVVGVIQSVYWSGQQTDPIHLDFNVSINNQVLIQTMTYGQMPTTNVSVEFTVYKFDPANGQKVFYQAFFSSSALSAIIHKHGQDLALNVAVENDPTVPIPLNYLCRLVIDPVENSAQVIQTAQSNTAKSTKPWGVTN